MNVTWGYLVKIITGVCLFAVMLTGCSAPPVKKVISFFPPPPNPPRIQYLMSVEDSTAVEEQSSQMVLFLAGVSKEEQMKRIMKPYGVATHKGKIYVCDSGTGNIAIIDLQKKQFTFLKGNTSLGRLKKPINLTLDRLGNLYVADTIRKEVVKYDVEGNYSRSYGKELDMKPVDMVVDDDAIYALDISSAQIHVIDLRSGQLLRSIGKGDGGTDKLNIPTNLTMDDKGFLYVTNIGNGNVIKMDKDGHVLKTFGKMGDGFGEFSRPKGIAVDEEGNFYVADAGHQNVQMFNEAGRLLIFFGDPPLPPDSGAMNLPAGIAVTTDNLEYFQKLAAPGFILKRIIIVTNMFGGDKVAFYGLGEMKQGGEGKPAAERKSP